jgi:GNAT superfamily N-acetyltransferase
MNNLNYKELNFREATVDDIAQIQLVRNSVKENVLLNPDLVTDEQCLDFITNRGKGWICEIDSKIIGFSIVDLKERNVWALFINPDYERNGIGKQLQKIMLDWYFKQTSHNIWLGTDPKTRAEHFYRKSGWSEIGTHENGEIKFEMSKENWNRYSR